METFTITNTQNIDELTNQNRPTKLNLINYIKNNNIDEHIKNCVYMFTNKINGKRYIGITRRSIYIRLKQHLYRTTKDKSCPAFSAAINKYGINSFKLKILDICHVEDLFINERKWIAHYNSISPNGYNLTDGGLYNHVVSDETRYKQRLAKLGTTQTQETIQKRTHAIKASWTPERKNRASELRKGKKQSPESIKKRSNKHKGFKFSEEQCINLSRSHMNGKQIFCLNNNKIYLSTYEASIDTGANQSHIGSICNNKRKSSMGFKFKYHTTDGNII